MATTYEDLVKGNALYKLSALIRYFHFDYNVICKFLNERRNEYFTQEELNEISVTIDEILASIDRYDLYCKDNNLI